MVKRMMDDYKNIPFIKENGEMDLWTCPHRNSQWLFKNGLRHDDSYQEIAGAAIYPMEYFSPKDAWSRQTVKTPNTYSITTVMEPGIQKKPGRNTCGVI